MNALMLQRDADRARRLIAGLNDEQSVRTLRRYVAEIEAQLATMTMPESIEHRR